MSDDEKTDILLGEYEATAANLVKGVNVCPETMNRYHGITGQLLAHVIRSLWTQQDLQTQVENLIAAKCEKCERKMSGGVTAGAIVATVSGVAAALRPIAWPLAVICFSPDAVEIFRLVIEVFSRQ